MPIEIKELEIAVNIQDAGGRDSGQAQAVDRKKIIAECVEKVLQILADKQER